MAVTYIEQPAVAGTYIASDLPQIFVFQSNQTTQPNFSFIVETRINGALVSTDVVFPEAGTRAHFDASKIIKNYIGKPLRSEAIVVLQDLPTLQLTVRERYGAVPTLQVGTVSLIYRVVKSAIDLELYQPSAYRWLTDQPFRPTRVKSDAYQRLSVLWNPADDARILIDCVKFDGTTVPTMAFPVYTGMRRLSLNISLVALENQFGGALIDSVQTLTVSFDAAPVEPYVFEFVPPSCSTLTQVSWLSNLGAFEQFLFDHSLTEGRSIKAFDYKKPERRWQGISYLPDPDAGENTVVKLIELTGSMSSGWLSQAQQNWLIMIYESIDVAIEADLSFKKIQIQKTTTELQQDRFEDLFNETFTFTSSSRKSLLS